MQERIAKVTERALRGENRFPIYINFLLLIGFHETAQIGKTLICRKSGYGFERGSEKRVLKAFQLYIYYLIDI